MEATSDHIIWADAEVHLFPPEWCASQYRPAAAEKVMRRVIYDHPEREPALSRASADGLLTEMEHTGIDYAVITALPWMEPETCRANNAYIARVVREHAPRFIGLGVLPPPQVVPPADAVKRMHEAFGLSGVKTIPNWQQFRLDDPMLEPAIEYMIEHHLILMPHTDYLFVHHDQADTAASLYNVCLRFPELRILAPHLGGLLCLHGLYPVVAESFRNILFITTVPKTMTMIRYALDAVGPDKLAFGTDFPFNPPHNQSAVKQAFLDLRLGSAAQKKIAGRNLLNFFGMAS